MEPPAPIATQLRLDEDGGILDDDLVCLACGYRLRGLAPEGACPERGTLVGRSIHGNLLRFCDPHWIGRLALGAQFIVAALIVNFLLNCCCGGCALLEDMGRAPIANSVALGIATTLRFIGYWLLTTADPSTSDTDGGLEARQVARVAGLVQFPLALILPLSSIFGHPPTAVALTVANVAIGVVALLAIFIYGRQLALRIPDQRLARQTRRVMWCLVASYLMVRIGGATVAATLGITGTPLPPGLGGTGTLAVVLAGAMLVFVFVFVWTLLLADSYVKALKLAALQARLNWALDPRSARAFH